MYLAGNVNKFKVLYETTNFILRYHLSRHPEQRDAIVLANLTVSQNPFHPLFARTNEKYIDRSHKLAIHITPSKKVLSNKSSVRLGVSRRIRHAVTESLRARGYTKDGLIDKPMDRNRIGIGERNKGKEIPVRGALLFFPYEQAITTKMEDLSVEVQACVDVFLDMHEKGNIRNRERDSRYGDKDRGKKRDYNYRSSENYNRQQEQQHHHYHYPNRQTNPYPTNKNPKISESNTQPQYAKKWSHAQNSFDGNTRKPTTGTAPDSTTQPEDVGIINKKSLPSPRQLQSESTNFPQGNNIKPWFINPPPFYSKAEIPKSASDTKKPSTSSESASPPSQEDKKPSFTIRRTFKGNSEEKPSKR